MKMKTRAHLQTSLLLLPLALLAACSDDTSEAAGTADSGSDTTVEDTGTSDTGSDTTVEDTGTTDTSTDTGSDTTVEDTGTTDTGTTDTGPGPVTGVPPLINEVSAASTPDWFEIYNPNDEPLSLNDFYFSDDELAPQRTLFPFGITIPARGFYQQTLDAVFPGFALGAAETLVIADIGGVIVDAVTWIDGDSPAGESFGRIPRAKALSSGSTPPRLARRTSTIRRPPVVTAGSMPARPATMATRRPATAAALSAWWSSLSRTVAMAR